MLNLERQLLDLILLSRNSLVGSLVLFLLKLYLLLHVLPNVLFLFVESAHCVPKVFIFSFEVFNLSQQTLVVFLLLHIVLLEVHHDLKLLVTLVLEFL
jgi:hypothetical protein